MRAVVGGRRGGKAEAVTVPKHVTVSVLCFPHIAEASCSRCEGTAKLDGEKADAERELGRFVVRHRRCSPRTGMVRPRVQVGSVAPSDEWLRAFERAKEGGDGT